MSLANVPDREQISDPPPMVFYNHGLKTIWKYLTQVEISIKSAF